MVYFLNRLNRISLSITFIILVVVMMRLKLIESYKFVHKIQSFSLSKLRSTSSSEIATNSSPDEIKTIKLKAHKKRDGTGKPKGYYEARYILESGLKSGSPDITKPFLMLGIESSCDDTGVAIVKSDGTILSNVVYSQYDVHSKFGGVVPSLAMESHKNNIDKAINDALAQANLTSISDVDAISVTKGPGLEICLRVGLRKAQVCTTFTYILQHIYYCTNSLLHALLVYNIFYTHLGAS